MFMAFAMQPLLAQVSYAAADGGAAFAYYRSEGGAAGALFTDSQNRWKWSTQPVDPATGGLVGRPAAATAGLRLPGAAWALLGSKNASRASVGAGWARPGVRMLFFSAPVGDAAGVVSAAVDVDALLGAAAARVAHQMDLDVYYAIGGEPATATDYKPLLLGRQLRYGDTREQKMRAFSMARCAAAAAIDAPKLGNLVSVGHGLYNKYKIACTNFDVSGVQLVRGHVLQTSTRMH
jgi:hypothetical protein